MNLYIGNRLFRIGKRIPYDCMKIMKLDLAIVRTKEELMDWFQENFHFPEYFGRNWDAVEECLQSMGQKRMAIEILNEDKVSDEMKFEMKTFKVVLKDIGKA